MFLIHNDPVKYWIKILGLPRWLSDKESTFQAGDSSSIPWEDPLEKEMETYSSILAWKIPWTEEPDRLQSMEPQRAGDSLVTKQQHNIFFFQ